MGLYKESVADAKTIKEAALSEAKRELIESITPQIKEIIENKINGASEDVDRLRRAMDGYGETEFEEACEKGDAKMKKDDKKEKDMEESIASAFGVSEAEDEEDKEKVDELNYEMSEMDDDDEFPVKEAGDDYDVEENQIPTLGEDEDKKEDDELEEEDDELEEVYIDEKALSKYEDAMKKVTEATVTSGFADKMKTTEWETEDSKPSDTGLSDEKSGDAYWDEVEPPAKQDYSVKEQAVREVSKAMKESRFVRGYIRHLEGKIKNLHKENIKNKNLISNSRIWNKKLLETNKLLSTFRLTSEEKKAMFKCMNEAKTLREATLVAESLRKQFVLGGKMKKIKENKRKPVARAQRVLKNGALNEKVLRETVDKSTNTEFGRWTELAGLRKLTS